MPQMAPLPWAPLMISSILLISLFTTSIFWNTPPHKKEDSAPLTQKNLSWKW